MTWKLRFFDAEVNSSLDCLIYIPSKAQWNAITFKQKMGILEKSSVRTNTMNLYHTNNILDTERFKTIPLFSPTCLSFELPSFIISFSFLPLQDGRWENMANGLNILILMWQQASLSSSTFLASPHSVIGWGSLPFPLLMSSTIQSSVLRVRTLYWRQIVNCWQLLINQKCATWNSPYHLKAPCMSNHKRKLKFDLNFLVQIARVNLVETCIIVPTWL